jgi:hypothetical protein
VQHQQRSKSHRRRVQATAKKTYARIGQGGNNIINCGSDASLDNLTAANFTAELWFTPMNVEYEWRRLFGKSVGWGTGWILMLNGADGAVRIDFDTTDISFQVASPDFALAVPVHFALTYNAATKTVQLWKAGLAYGDPVAGVGNLVSDAACNLHFGWTAAPLDAKIYWARLSNTLRYTDTFTPPSRLVPPDADDNTIEQWNFEEGQGTTLAALVSANNNGTLQAANWGAD